MRLRAYLCTSVEEESHVPLPRKRVSYRGGSDSNFCGSELKMAIFSGFLQQIMLHLT